MAKPLYDISPFTLLDYPNKAACIFWFAGCNMRCLYCYNPDIVLGKGKIGLSEAYSFLNSRKGLLQAVVFSGGECTMHPDLLPLAQYAKSLGYLIKVDTNGSRPKVLKEMLQSGLLDYVALDYKAPAELYQKITLLNSYPEFEETLDMLLTSDIPFEVRTTVHSELLQTADLQRMLEFLESKNYSGNYYLQLALNQVKMLQDLGPSHYSKQNLQLSSPNIAVVLRD